MRLLNHEGSDSGEDQLARVLEKNTELTIKNTNLQKQVQQLQNVRGTDLPCASEKLESILKQMREANDRKKEIEKEHTEALNLLKEQQSDIQKKLSSTSEKTKAYESIESLQSKIRELEKKAELQNVLHEELVLEMAAIKRSTKGGATPGQQLHGTSVNQPGVTWNKNNESQMSPDSMISTSDGNNVEQSLMAQTNSHDTIHKELRPILKRSQYGVTSSAQQPVSAEVMHMHPPQNITSEIDSIMEKIEQDNRVLAELDKSRYTIGHGTVTSRQLPLQPKLSSTLSGHTTCTNISAQPSTMSVTGLTSLTDPLNRHTLTSSIVDGTSYVVPGTGLSMLPQVGQSSLPLSLTQSGMVNPLGTQYHSLLLGGGPGAPALRGQPLMIHQTQTQPRMMPQLPPMAQFELDRLYSTFPDQHLSLGQDPKVVDMLDIPGKGRCYVYIARYSYDPFQQSPNECPEAELAVNAGDYILVWGNMDEDGFYDAELLDGRRGLVPSNFVQKLVGDDLLDFHQSVVQGLRDCDDSASTNIPQDLDYHHGHPVEFYSKRTIGDYDLGDIIEEEEEEEDADHAGEGPVAAPKQLTLERQLNKSILIGWNPPDTPSPAIDCYHVYVDRVLKVTVKAIERTRALVEGVDSNRPHRISVRSVTANRRTSRDAACTMVIGKDVPLGPTNVKATRVTATSAVIYWLPSNSNYQHTVCVNNVELRTVKPGVYRHTITGLAANTVYRVTVRAKNIRAPNFDEKSNINMEKYACHIDFRTLPKGCKGLPEPPVDIQVEPGPQDGTLLVTWQPSTLLSSPSGTSVTGYAVYADGKKVTDVDSPTGDHALIDINKLLSLNPKQVTVRTKSRDNQSSDSLPTQIPQHILKGKQINGKHQEDDRRMRYGSSIPPHMRNHHRPGQVIETEENLSDKEIYPNSHMSIPAIDTGSEGNFSEEDYMDRKMGGRGPHYDNRGAQRGGRHPHHPGSGSGSAGHHQRQYNRRDDRDQFYMDRGADGPGGRFDRGDRGGPVQYNSRNPQRGTQPQSQQCTRDKRARWFVALFDYDPTTMSPNPDACEEELPFSEGDTIKVFGDKDADGFYWGECRGRRGFVPHNMVVEVQGVEGGAAPCKERNRDRDRWGDIYANMPVKKMVAMYDYDPQELSPNVDAVQVELSFQTGNIIYVYGEMDDDGFYMGELDGVRGLVPSNFLTEAPPEYNTGGTSGSQQGGIKGNRGGPPQRLMQQDRSQGDRGHGPGARGPPPPPRSDQRPDRRKDACPVPTQVDLRQDGRAEKESIGGGMLARVGNLTRKYQAPPNPTLSNNISDFKQGINQTTVGQPQQQQSQPQHTESSGPNLMQKLTEMTAGDNSVDHILSKGKELIFMKFGLGK
ncbi:Variant SH3 domain [Nesidiocoris tenuis]|uniref:Variant SH3 domain n=2 Tax=Nesidiocoris tenuis TaxID=355587 RepID=A0ABN7AG44_9HEMI|nr:Variant SH3 domain [Nesidiocoris tenuis]